jgi:hypothetical protein
MGQITVRQGILISSTTLPGLVFFYPIQLNLFCPLHPPPFYEADQWHQICHRSRTRVVSPDLVLNLIFCLLNSYPTSRQLLDQNIALGFAYFPAAVVRQGELKQNILVD